MKNKTPQVVIFGRTNVGKSTLFNRLTETNKALVSNIEGTTRDANIADVEWRGKIFSLVDTGGIIDINSLIKQNKNTEDVDIKVQQQAKEKLNQADLILFLIDARDGLMPQDKKLVLFLKKNIPNIEKKIILVANKSDSEKQRKNLAETYKLALGEAVPISAVSGSGTGDLLDIIIPRLKFKKQIKAKEENFKRPIKICLLGKPNAGKSSLINKLINEDRIIISATPHTTREPQDIEINYKDEKIVFIDTAGISKSGQKRLKTKQGRLGHSTKALEKLSIEKSLASLAQADIAFFVFDISKELTKQDSKIIEEVIKNKKSLVLIANKWDKIKEKDTKKYTQAIYASLPFVHWAPIQFVSALTGQKIKKVLDLAIEMKKQREIALSEAQLDRFLFKIVKKHKPAKAKGTKHPHIYKIKQVKINPPIFELKIGSKDTLHFSYVRFIENRLREKYNIIGTPITIIVKNNKRIHGKHETK